MAIHLKADPVGIDKVIDRIQKLVHDPIVTAWGETDVYGRAYRVKDGKKTTLKVYSGNNEYEPILYSEGNKVFFIQGDSTNTKEGRETNDLWVVSILKLDSGSERKDEEAHVEMVSLIAGKYLDEYKGCKYGIDELKKIVENDFFGNFKFGDIHPNHVFMVRLKVNYYLTNSSICSC